MLYWMGGIMKSSETSSYLGHRYFLKADWTWSIIPQSETFRLDKSRIPDKGPL
jgi:hypothetical protein